MRGTKRWGDQAEEERGILDTKQGDLEPIASQEAEITGKKKKSTTGI